MPQYFQRANYIEGGVAPRDAPSIAIPTQNPALQAKESLYKTIDQRVSEAKEALGEACGSKVIELAGKLEQENPYVAMKGYMWAASRLDPESFGDKKQVKIEQNVSQQHIIELRQMQRDRDTKVMEAAD